MTQNCCAEEFALCQFMKFLLISKTPKLFLAGRERANSEVGRRGGVHHCQARPQGELLELNLGLDVHYGLDEHLIYGHWR